MKPARLPLLLLLVAGPAVAAEPATGLPRTSPFLPASAAGAPAQAAAETVEFIGIFSTVGKRTDLIFHDKATKKNHWIAQGETKEGIAVISYDEPRQQAVVKINGAEKTLAMRKAAAAPRAPVRTVATPPSGFNVATAPAGPAAPAVELNVAPVAAAAGQPALTIAPAPAGPAAPATAEATRIKQETEARMLVSDLLEIGMAQRKAYEEAQRKAATGESSAAAPAPPANPQ